MTFKFHGKASKLLRHVPLMGLYRKYAAILEKNVFFYFYGQKTTKNGQRQSKWLSGHQFQPIKIERKILGKSLHIFDLCMTLSEHARPFFGYSS